MTDTKTPKTNPQPKKQILIGLLKRKNGALINDIVKATSWQPHTSRAAMSGLRKEGYTIESEPTDRGRRYQIISEPAQ